MGHLNLPSIPALHRFPAIADDTLVWFVNRVLKGRIAFDALASLSSARIMFLKIKLSVRYLLPRFPFDIFTAKKG